MTGAMTAWSANVSDGDFAARFFGRAADDPAVEKLRGAALDIRSASTHAELRDAAEKVAGAIRTIGLDRWPRFLADAQARAGDATETITGDITPMPLVDDDGKAVMNDKGETMMRPVGMDPHFFVNQGLKDKKIEEGLLATGTAAGVSAALAYQDLALSKFWHWFRWDAQRIGGRFHPEFIDYSTVAIGLYAAANGISRNEILIIEDTGARFSTFGKDTKTDPDYPNLPLRNVQNADLGYWLYKIGRTGPTL